MPYSFGVHNDGFTRRGVLYAEVSIGGEELNGKIQNSASLHLFTTHMQSSYIFPYDTAPGILKQAI